MKNNPETYNTAENELGIVITHSAVKIPPEVEKAIIEDIVVPLEGDLDRELLDSNSADGALPKNHQTLNKDRRMSEEYSKSTDNYCVDQVLENRLERGEEK